MTTSKQVLDSLLAANSAAEVADILEINRGNIHHYIHRYNKKKVPKIIHDALVEQGLITVKKRIRSQVTWKSKKQKLVFLKYIKKQGFHSITEYCRDQANAVRDGALVGGFIPYLTVDHIGESLGRYPIDTGEDL